MKDWGKLGTVLLLLLSTCSGDHLAGYSDAEVRKVARGYWEAVGGDTSVTETEAIIAYNWYAIDTEAHGDSVSVLWDNGRTCTKSWGKMRGAVITFSAQSYQVTITIEMQGKARASFKSATHSYKKKLKKTREDPSVICH